VFESPPVRERFSYIEQHGKCGDRIEVRRLWATIALKNAKEHQRFAPTILLDI
jgi:hypothetical protein